MNSLRRKIIEIDENKCNGCGLCIPDCPEGALQLIEGKARLVSDLFCDGLGACIGTCPEGAITVVEREAEPYDERKVMANIVPKGPAVIKAHLEHLREHGEEDLYGQAVSYLRDNNIDVPQDTCDDGHGGKGHSHGGGCPGAAAFSFGEESDTKKTFTAELQSELRQWPVQLKLLNPQAPYLKNADLLLVADCVPAAYADFHRKFVKGRVVVMFCPKLDPYIDEYVDKLAAILKTQDIQSVTVARMEVPCCGGITHALKRAVQKSGVGVLIREETVSIRGEILPV